MQSETHLLGTNADQRISLLLVLLLALLTCVVVGRNVSIASKQLPLLPAVLATQPYTRLEPGALVNALKSSSGVEIRYGLSQTKMVQGERGEIFLTLSMQPPMPSLATVREPADVVVVLDHSGSMAAENRLPLARKAIHELLDRLGENDRFALILFDSRAQTLVPLSSVSASARLQFHHIIEGVTVGSGTNLGAGIQLAQSVLAASDHDRLRKVMLLSDGEANEGIVDPRSLGSLAAQMHAAKAMLSTIGMGLGFNEQLMASLADWGGGTFSYLESLEGLASILSKDLEETRQVFAGGSSVELQLGNGVLLRDAGGYPYEMHGSSQLVRTGPLLAGTEKRLTLTLQIPTESTGSHSLGAVKVSVEGRQGEQAEVVTLERGALVVEVRDAQQRQEVLASVNQQLLQDSWLNNNLAVAKRNIREALAQGDARAAQNNLSSYEKQLAEAEQRTGQVLTTEKLTSEMRAIREAIVASDQGTMSERSLKQNRLGKKLFGEGWLQQRGKGSF